MSQTPQKPGPKMCKSPKNSNFQKHDKIDYEHLSTNCTVVGSNNLNLVKKPQIVTSMSPAYSNPSPGYPPSPYSSPASLKSPSPSLKPPTPQPNFPVMQIIHNNHPLLARPIQTSQPQNIIKLKPHLNILPKPAASPQPSPKPSVSPQIVIPTNQPAATIMPTAQPLLLNQMPMITTQFILRPQTTTKIPTQMPTATPQGLILQSGAQPLLQIQPPRSQPMVRVLTNGVQLAPSSTTYVTQMGNQQPINATQVAQQQNIINSTQTTIKKKPKNKVKKKLDLANIMKLSGIGDEDDIQFESDTSQSESEHNSVPNTQQTQNVVQTSTVQATNLVQTTDAKKIGNIQISAMPQPTINTTPVVQVLNQNFQSGMISNSTSQAATAQASIPFNSFITPNFTINNGLMLQRSGGFKLTMGEDGRLVLQHDPTLNQDLQSQLILQSLLGLNGGLVLQPSVDQQTVQQTVQTIQQQSVQTIQQQTVQSQTIQTVQQQTVQPQTVQHTLQSLQPQIQQQTVQQTIQHQTVQSQPITALQQPMQIVQPQPIHSIHSQVQPQVHSIQSQVHSLSHIQGQIQSLLQQQNHAVQSHVQQPVVQPQPIPSPVQFNQHHTQTTQTNQPVLKVQPFQKSQPPVQTVHPQPIQTIHQQQQQQQQQQQNLNDSPQNPPPTSYVVNLTPDQLEQLKRNGQLTVNGQTIFMQRSNKQEQTNEKKHSPKIKPVKKVNKIQSVKNFMADNDSMVKSINNTEQIKETSKSSLITALQSPPKHILPQNHVQPQTKPIQPSAMVSPSVVQHQPIKVERQKSPLPSQPKTQIQQQKVQPTVQQQTNDSNGAATQDVDKLLGQLLEESNNISSNNNGNNANTTPLQSVPPQQQQQQQQRITTIQLTPQKQQHLKSIQLQIQTLSARLTPGDTEMQNALKLLFAEQQKILASGKLLPPDKVYYHNNQLTIVNPSTLNATTATVKTEQHSPVQGNVSSSASGVVVRNTGVETLISHQPVTTQTHSVSVSPRISVTVPSSSSTSITTTESSTQSTAQSLPHIVTSQSASNHSLNQRLNIHQSQPLTVQQQQQQHLNALAKKAQLVETQLNLDQNGAVKPDIHTPFRDKKDACIRLIRYHCMDQPVLSQKDLDKADEIFELTARHFIGKYAKMVDKYKYLLMKESMRQVQTSELMMLDRMFLAEEQQSLLRLRQECETQSLENLLPELVPNQQQIHNNPQYTSTQQDQQQTSTPSMNVNSLQGSNSNYQDSQSEDYDEWACIQRELGCLPSNEEQTRVNQTPASTFHNSNVQQHQRVAPTTFQSSNSNLQSRTTTFQTNNSNIQQQQQPVRVSAFQSNVAQQHSRTSQSSVSAFQSHNSNVQQQQQPPKRSASTDSRLETLKKYRVDKHVKKNIDSVHNNSVSNSVQSVISSMSSNSHFTQSSTMLRLNNTTITTQSHHHHHQQQQHVINSMQQTNNQSCSFETTNHNSMQQNNSSYSSQDDNETENNSIDEQVQSAIDSILNLQQNTALDLDSILS